MRLRFASLRHAEQVAAIYAPIVETTAISFELIPPGHAGRAGSANAWGRRKVTIVYFASSLVLTPALSLWSHSLPLVLVLCAVDGSLFAGTLIVRFGGYGKAATVVGTI